jgi:hypothetical protein
MVPQVMAIHVDEFIHGGTSTFLDSVIEESSVMKYIGIAIKQNNRGIKLSTDAYSNNLKDIANLSIDKTGYSMRGKPEISGIFRAIST